MYVVKTNVEIIELFILLTTIQMSCDYYDVGTKFISTTCTYYNCLDLACRVPEYKLRFTNLSNTVTKNIYIYTLLLYNDWYLLR